MENLIHPKWLRFWNTHKHDTGRFKNSEDKGEDFLIPGLLTLIKNFFTRRI